MGIHIENESFDELDQDILLVKGGPGDQSGGTPPLGSLAAPADLEESASHHESADLLSRRVRMLLPGGFTLLKWFPLGADRTKCVSLDKTRHSSAEVLISGTLRVGGRMRGTPNFRSTKQILFAPASFFVRQNK